jgi:hypothetical protein
MVRFKGLASALNSLVQMIRQRVCQIVAGYEDCNDAHIPPAGTVGNSGRRGKAEANVLPMIQFGFEMRIVLKPSLGPRDPENLLMIETAIDAA